MTEIGTDSCKRLLESFQKMPQNDDEGPVARYPVRRTTYWIFAAIHCVRYRDHSGPGISESAAPKLNWFLVGVGPFSVLHTRGVPSRLSGLYANAHTDWDALRSLIRSLDNRKKWPLPAHCTLCERIRIMNGKMCDRYAASQFKEYTSGCKYPEKAVTR